MNNYQLTIDNYRLKEGYKQTEVGVIPEDWHIKTLGEISDFNNGKAHENHIDEFGKYIVVNSKFISSNAEVKKYSNICFCKTSKNNILMVMSDIPNGKAIAKCFFVEDGNLYTVNQRICSLEITTENPRFIFYRLNRNPYYLQFDDGVKQTNLRRNEVLSCPLPIPPIPEQHSIAQALSDVDALIASLDKLIAKQRHLKTAAMQQLLTGKMRLPGFGEGKGYKQTEIGVIPKDWDVRCLGEVGQSLIGLTYRPEDTRDYGTLVLRSSNVQNDRLAYENNVYVDSTLPLPSRVIVEEGDILICVRNGSKQLIGKCALINAEVAGSAFGAFMSVFRTKISGFVFYQFQSDVIQTQINEIMGATINQITNKDMAAFQIPVPPSDEEQCAIATVLSDMDSAIAALETRRAKTQAIKQGMMQELLTGRTRLI
jgi:type I restriction enzyme, S subunit